VCRESSVCWNNGMETKYSLIDACILKAIESSFRIRGEVCI
jgi:hypothetical protein